MIGGWDFSYEIALRWMSLDITDDKSTLVHVMAWCYQARQAITWANFDSDLCHHLASRAVIEVLPSLTMFVIYLQQIFVLLLAFLKI